MREEEGREGRQDALSEVRTIVVRLGAGIEKCQCGRPGAVERAARRKASRGRGWLDEGGVARRRHLARPSFGRQVVLLRPLYSRQPFPPLQPRPLVAAILLNLDPSSRRQQRACGPRGRRVAEQCDHRL